MTKEGRSKFGLDSRKRNTISSSNSWKQTDDFFIQWCCYYRTNVIQLHVRKLPRGNWVDQKGNGFQVVS